MTAPITPAGFTLPHSKEDEKYIVGVMVPAKLAEDACICARAWSDVAGQGLGAIYDIAKGEWSTWSYDNL